MARKPRLEVEGGLYHIITRGNDRRDIFHSIQDFQRFIALLKAQKERLPFYLYAFCLMTNHIHLLIERRTDDVGRIMHRLLTGYSQYYNRRYHNVGHVMQGRYKSILCQSDPYLGELVRYIHLNPVRAKMVAKPEDYPHSSHRAYMGIEPYGAIDVDPVLRRFGPNKERARERFANHVAAGMGHGHLDAFYEAKDGVLGSDEFVDSMIHRIGEYVPKGTPELKAEETVDADVLADAVETVCGLSRADLCGLGKSSQIVEARELLIVCGRRLGVPGKVLSELSNLSSASISRRHDAAVRKIKDDTMLRESADEVVRTYRMMTSERSSKTEASKTEA